MSIIVNCDCCKQSMTYGNQFQGFTVHNNTYFEFNIDGAPVQICYVCMSMVLSKMFMDSLECKQAIAAVRKRVIAEMSKRVQATIDVLNEFNSETDRN